MAQEGQGGERTERATPKKRRDARQRGQVRKSQELVTAVMLIALFAGLKAFSPGMWERMGSLASRSLAGQLMGSEMLAVGNLPRLMMNLSIELGLILLPMLALAVVVGTVVNMVQVGFLFATKALTPKFSKLNPISGIKRMFTLNTLYELAKSLLKVIIIGIIAYNKYIDSIVEFNRAIQYDMAEIGSVIIELVTDIGFAVGIALLILAALDYVYQWFKYERDLRMTKYEIKLEHRQQEGDPQVKSRIRQKQRQMATMRMMQAIPEADVVITNPTHYAVALKYDESTGRAPVVVAKGQDYVAQKIKEAAKEHGVTMVENKPVAQALYGMCELGDEVPLELYQAVAEILAYVYRLKKGK